LSTYFDGGKQADSRVYDVVTLASIHGTARQWDELDKQWRRVLKKHGAEYLHVTDCIGGLRHYDGWKVEERQAFLKACVRLLGKHTATKNGGESPRRDGILPSTATVVLKDFIEARKTRTDIANTAEELLIRQATAVSATWADVKKTKWFRYFFDQGEKYRGYVCDMKTSPGARAAAPWLDRIIHNAEVNMRLHPGIQVADLYAWCVSNKNVDRGFAWQAKLLRMDRFDQWIDESNIAETINGSQEVWDAWRLPKRAMTK